MYNKIIYLFIVSALLSCSNDDEVSETRATYETYEECTNIPRPTDTYIFPAYPGNAAWQTLLEKSGGDVKEIRKALQVPEKQLKTMSTAGLIQTWLDFPFNIEISAYDARMYLVDKYFYGSEAMNFCQELIKRDDASNCLMEIYECFNPDGCQQASYIYSWLAMLMGLTEIQNQLSLKQKHDLIELSLRKYRLLDGSNIITYSSIAFVAGNILKSIQYAPMLELMASDDLMKDFINFWFSDTATRERSDLIMAYAEDYIKKKLL